MSESVTEKYPDLFAELAHRIDLCGDGSVQDAWEALVAKIDHHSSPGASRFCFMADHRIGQLMAELDAVKSVRTADQRHDEASSQVRLPTVDVPVRDDNGWGLLRIETVPEYLADRERLTRALTSLAKAWPYVAKYADHIDGEYNNALDDVRRCVEWAIRVSESVVKPTG